MIVNRLREWAAAGGPQGRLAGILPEPAAGGAPALRWVDCIALPLCLLLLAPVLVYASNGTAPLLGVLALLYLPRVGRSLPGLRRARQRHWLLPLCFLVLWAAASALWSLRPMDDLVSASQLALTMAIGILTVRGICLGVPVDAHRAALFLPAAAALTALLAGTEILLDFPVTRRMLAEAPDFIGPDFLFLNNIARGMPVLLLLLWPSAYLLAVLHRRRLAAAALVGLSAALILALPMGATKVALVLSALLGLAALWRPKVAVLLAAGGAMAAAALMAALLLLAPQDRMADTASAWLPESWSHRLVIWRFSSDHIAVRPAIGFGFDSSRKLGNDLARTDAMTPAVVGNAAQRLPLHPHSMPVQVWLELGAVGLLAVGLVLLGVLRLVWRMAGDRAGAAMALATLVSWLTVACLSFGAWQTWWLSAAWLGVAAVALVRRAAAVRAPAGQPSAGGSVSRADGSPARIAASTSGSAS